MAEPATDPVHGVEAERWGGWHWREPRRGATFRTCSYCGSIHPDDLAAMHFAGSVCTICGKDGWSACFTAQQGLDFTHAYDPGGIYGTWADRKYGWPHKLYVERVPPADPDMLFCIEGGSLRDGETPPDRKGMTYVKVSELTSEQREICERDGMVYSGSKQDGYVGLGKRTSVATKFYTIHLADPAIPEESREAIARLSGLRFDFKGGIVHWSGV